MAPRVSGIPHHGERASLQSIKDRNWVIQTDLYPAGKGTIAGAGEVLAAKPGLAGTGNGGRRVVEDGKGALGWRDVLASRFATHCGPANSSKRACHRSRSAE